MSSNIPLFQTIPFTEFYPDLNHELRRQNIKSFIFMTLKPDTRALISPC